MSWEQNGWEQNGWGQNGWGQNKGSFNAKSHNKPKEKSLEDTQRQLRVEGALSLIMNSLQQAVKDEVKSFVLPIGEIGEIRKHYSRYFLMSSFTYYFILFIVSLLFIFVVPYFGFVVVLSSYILMYYFSPENFFDWIIKGNNMKDDRDSYEYVFSSIFGERQSFLYSMFLVIYMAILIPTCLFNSFDWVFVNETTELLFNVLPYSENIITTSPIVFFVSISSILISFTITILNFFRA